MLWSPFHFSKQGVNEGVNISPKEQISPLGARVEVKNGKQEPDGSFLTDFQAYSKRLRLANVGSAQLAPRHEVGA
jgi:hypothetical protein